MLNRALLTCLTLLLLVVAPSMVRAETHTFTLHNRTGVDIHMLLLAHHSAADWDENDDLLEGAVMQAGAELTIKLKKSAPSWDLRVVDKEGGFLEWSDLNLNGAEDVVLEKNGVARLK